MDKQKKIMIVDDNESFVESLIFFIKQLGCENIIFNKFYLGIEALEASTNICYDYIFMNVNLPDISGIDITKKISENNRYVKIIAISYNNDMFNVRKMLEAGAKNYLIKDELTLSNLKRILCNDKH